MFHRNRLWNSLFLHPDAPPANPPATGGFNPNMSDDELATKIRKIISKHDGNSEDAIGILLRDNAEIREKNRQANKALQEATTIKPGAIVLEGDEAKAIQTLKTKGVDISKIPSIVDEHGSLREFKTSVETKEVHKKAAQALGWDSDILSDQLNLRKLHVEMKDETIKEGDKTVVRSMPYARPADNDKAALEPLGSYAEKNFPKPYMELLKTTKGDAQSVGDGTGVEYVPQHSSEQGSGAQGKNKDLTKSYLEANYGGRLPFEPEKAQ